MSEKDIQYGYAERRGVGRLGRALSERHQDYPNYHNEFEHLRKLDTIQGKNNVVQ